MFNKQEYFNMQLPITVWTKGYSCFTVNQVLDTVSKNTFHSMASVMD